MESTSDLIEAPYTSAPIRPDDFANNFWEQCAPVTIAHEWSGAPAPLERHAEVRLCWSDEALHVRFVGNQHEPLIVSKSPVLDRKTVGLWDGDVVELFVAPNIDEPERYFEFEVAPTGEWVDLGIAITASGRETDWDYASAALA